MGCFPHVHGKEIDVVHKRERVLLGWKLFQTSDISDKRHVLDVGETTFLHDRAPCMSALATQNMLTANGIDFFGNSEWPGSSPDLNPCENLGAILKDRVEHRLENSGETLEEALHNTLTDMEYDRDLFTSLLLSYPSRLTSVKESNGGQTKF